MPWSKLANPGQNTSHLCLFALTWKSSLVFLFGLEHVGAKQLGLIYYDKGSGSYRQVEGI